MRQWACFECGQPCVLTVPDDCDGRPDLCSYQEHYKPIWKYRDFEAFKMPDKEAKDA